MHTHVRCALLCSVSRQCAGRSCKKDKVSVLAAAVSLIEDLHTTHGAWPPVGAGDMGSESDDDNMQTASAAAAGARTTAPAAGRPTLAAPVAATAIAQAVPTFSTFSSAGPPQYTSAVARDAMLAPTVVSPRRAPL
jgi:hypothetical protein